MVQMEALSNRSCSGLAAHIALVARQWVGLADTAMARAALRGV